MEKLNWFKDSNNITKLGTIIFVLLRIVGLLFLYSHSKGYTEDDLNQQSLTDSLIENFPLEILFIKNDSFVVTFEVLDTEQECNDSLNVEDVKIWYVDKSGFESIEGALSKSESDIERRAKHNLKKLASLLALFLSCFAGIAFLIIWNSIIKNFKKHESPSFIAFKKHRYFGWALIALSGAMLSWALVSIISFKASLEPNIKYDFIFSVLSTINSSCFLIAMLDFDVGKSESKWRKSFMSKPFNSLMGIAIVAGITIAFSFVITSLSETKDIYSESTNDLIFNYIYVPDIIFSIATLFFLGSGLWDIFRTRGLVWLNGLVVITLSMVLWRQFFKVFINDTINRWFFIPDHIIQFIVIILSAMFLVSIFFALALSYIQKIKEEQLSKKADEIQNARREMFHRVNNTLMFIKNNVEEEIEFFEEQKENIISVNTLKQILARTECFSLIHELLSNSNMKKSEYFEITITDANEINLQEYIDNILKQLNKLFSNKDDKFIYRITLPNSINIHLEEVQKIGLIIAELTINAIKAAKSNKTVKKITIEVNDIIGMALNIEVSDESGGIIESKESTGFGIPYVLNEVKKWKGEIDNYPNNLGGTTFKISIPFKQLLD